jgi:hypothetical protein
MNMRHFFGSGPAADMTVDKGEVMAVIGNRMEPIRGSARLSGDARTTAACGGRAATPK